MRALLAPVYLSVSWVLTVTYQLFTDTAVKTVAGSISTTWPTAGTWLISNTSILTFIYAFTWIFVLSSVIPSIILGKQRSVLVQYIVVLALTLIAFYMANILQVVAGVSIDELYRASEWLKNPIVAAVYLSVPYLFMIGLDVLSRRKIKRLEFLKTTSPFAKPSSKEDTPESSQQ
jgi:hypothetical protein